MSATERARHIGWDIGIDGVGRGLAEALPALLIEQVFSRLVIDCNRAPGHPTSIVRESDGTAVPGNQSLCEKQSGWREQAILHPYHARIRAELDARKARGQATCLIALHSFTPVMRGYARPWHAGILHNRDSRLAHIMLDLLRGEGLCVGDNEPYALTDTSDYTVPEHAERRGLPYIEIEIRQDLITAPEGRRNGPRVWRGCCPPHGRLLANAMEMPHDHRHRPAGFARTAHYRQGASCRGAGLAGRAFTLTTFA